MKRYIFDSSNLNESYSGVTTPLTYSFARYVYQEVYKHFCRMMGVEQSAVDKNSDLYEKMVEYIGGRMYYNLINWHRMITYLPGYKYNREFMEQMLGVKKEFRYETEVETNVFQRYFINLPKLVIQTVSIAFSFVRMGSLMKRFDRNFDATHAKVNNINLTKKSSKELVRIYNETQKALLSTWKIPIANDFAVMVSMGLARKLSKRWCDDKDGARIGAFLGNNRGIRTTEPGFEIEKILNLVRSNEGSLRLFQKESPDAIWSSLKDNKQQSSLVVKSINRYLLRFGGRAPNELKLETLSFTENPKVFIRFLKSQLKTSKKQVCSIELREKEFKEIQQLPLLQKWLFKRIISWAKNSIARRESARFKRALIFGFTRKIFRELGRRFVKQGIINKIDDVFFLTLDEVFKLTGKGVAEGDFKTKVFYRKQKFNYWQKIEVPERIETNLTVEEYDQMLWRERKSKVVREQASPQQQLKGVPVSRGGDQRLIRGESLVLTEFDPGVSFQNKILVTRQTDPGWTIVFPSLKGLVVERGGLLSHAAIVAREFGIPCIIGVEKATSLIEDNVQIQMNVIDGTIRCLV